MLVVFTLTQPLQAKTHKPKTQAHAGDAQRHAHASAAKSAAAEHRRMAKQTRKQAAAEAAHSGNGGAQKGKSKPSKRKQHTVAAAKDGSAWTGSLATASRKNAARKTASPRPTETASGNHASKAVATRDQKLANAASVESVAANAATAARIHAWERHRRQQAASAGQTGSHGSQRSPATAAAAPPPPDPRLLNADEKLLAGHPLAARRQAAARQNAGAGATPTTDAEKTFGAAPSADSKGQQPIAHPASAERNTDGMSSTEVAQPSEDSSVTSPADDENAIDDADASSPAKPETDMGQAEASRGLTAEADAATAKVPALDPVLFNRRGGLIVPPPLRGSREILVHQNTMADHEGLLRVKDDADLLQLRRQRQLVALPETEEMRVAEQLPENRRFCRPWTNTFLVDIGRSHYARFHQPLQVNSAVRTVAFQRRLRRINGNAAPIKGDTASPHLTGETIDIAKRGLSMTEIAWMRGYLLPLQQEGKIDVEEEFQQSVFHISVYKSYAAPAAEPKSPAERKSRSSLLAVGIR
ncbi:MAG: DUF5715 family protein [Acidobacteriaceae bacterium]